MLSIHKRRNPNFQLKDHIIHRSDESSSSRLPPSSDNAIHRFCCVLTLKDMKYLLFLFVISIVALVLGLLQNCTSKYSFFDTTPRFSNDPISFSEPDKVEKPPIIPELPTKNAAKPVESRTDDSSLETVLEEFLPEIPPLEDVNIYIADFQLDLANPKPFGIWKTAEKLSENSAQHLGDRNVVVRFPKFDEWVENAGQIELVGIEHPIHSKQEKVASLLSSSVRSLDEMEIQISGLIKGTSYTISSWHHAVDGKSMNAANPKAAKTTKFTMKWNDDAYKLQRTNGNKWRRHYCKLAVEVKADENGEIRGFMKADNPENTVDLNALRIRQHCTDDAECNFGQMICRRGMCIRDLYKLYLRVTVFDTRSQKFDWMFQEERAFAACCKDTDWETEFLEKCSAVTYFEAELFCTGNKLSVCDRWSIKRMQTKCNGVYWTYSMTKSRDQYPSNRVAVATMWIGEEWPSYVNLTMQGFAANEKEVDFYVFHNCKQGPPYIPRAKNIFIYKIDDKFIYERMQILFTDHAFPSSYLPANAAHDVKQIYDVDDHLNWHTIVEVELTLQNKIPGGLFNDLKIALADLFPDIFDNYSYWGWVDMDVLMGDVGGWINIMDRHTQETDAISFSEGLFKIVHVRGQMSWFRRRKDITSIWSGKRCTKRFIRSFRTLFDPIHFSKYSMTKDDEGCFSFEVFKTKGISVKLFPWQTLESHAKHIMYNGNKLYVCRYKWLKKCVQNIKHIPDTCEEKYVIGKISWSGRTEPRLWKDKGTCMSWVWGEFKTCIARSDEEIPKPNFITNEYITYNDGESELVHLQPVNFTDCITVETKMREVMFMHWKKQRRIFGSNFTFSPEPFEPGKWWIVNDEKMGFIHESDPEFA